MNTDVLATNQNDNIGTLDTNKSLRQIDKFLKDHGFDPELLRDRAPFSWQSRVHPGTQYTVQDFVVDRNMAAEILSTSDGNYRGVLGKEAFQYINNVLVRAMVARRWVPNHHQGIAFDTNGSLSNGHQRMMSIVISNFPQKFQATFNEPVEANLDATDRGRARSEIAILQTHGYNVKAGTLATAKRCHYSDSMRLPNLAPTHVMELWEKHSEVVEIAHRLVPTKSYLKGIANAGVRGAFARAAYHYSEDTLAGIADVLTKGITQDEKDPMIKLRNLLVGTPKKGLFAPAKIRPFLTSEGGSTILTATSNSDWVRYRCTEIAIACAIEGTSFRGWGRAKGSWESELFPLPSHV